jgi:hypothetical protein
MGCEENRKKHVGKIEFYREFVAHYGLKEDVKIKFRDEGGIDHHLRGYRCFREVDPSL